MIPHDARFGFGVRTKNGAPNNLVFVLGAVGLLGAAFVNGGAADGRVALLCSLAGSLVCLFSVFHPELRSAWRERRLTLLLFVLFGATVTSVAWSLRGGGPFPQSLDPSATTAELALLLGLGAWFAVGFVLGADRSRALAALLLILALGALFALIASASYLHRPDIALQRARLDAGLPSPNTAGALFGGLLCLAAGLFLRGLSGWRHGADRQIQAVASAVAAVILACGLLLTASRVAILATAAALLVLAIANAFRNRRFEVLGAIGALAAVIAGAAVFGGADLKVAERWEGLSSDWGTRSTIFATHLKVFEASPIGGHGLGTFEALNKEALTPENFQRLWSIGAAHNVAIQWLEEAGLVGAMPLFLLICVVIISTWQAAMKRRLMRDLTAALLAFNVVILANGMLDIALQCYAVAALWALLLGLQLSLSGPHAERPPKGALEVVNSGLVSVTALSAIGLSALTLIALAAGGAVNLGPAGRFKIAAGYEVAAAEAFGRGGPKGLAEAEAATREALAIRPRSTLSWTRLAVIDATRNERLTADGVSALKRSYGLAWIDPRLSMDRLAFCLAVWPYLPDDLKDSAEREFSTLAESGSHRAALRRTLNGVTALQGRMVASIWIDRLNRNSSTELLRPER